MSEPCTAETLRVASSESAACSTWTGEVTFHVEHKPKLCSSGCGRPRDVGYDTRCRLCRNAEKNANRIKHRDLSPAAKKRAHCRSYAKTLIARGMLIPQPCEDCAATDRIESHHDDYDQPRQVRWKCHDCHVKHHRALRGNLCSVCRAVPKRPGQTDCHECHAKYMREHRPKHRDLPEPQRQKSNCRSYVNVLLRRGKLERKPCADCGDPAGPDVRPRHDDYSKPRVISRWTCDECERHRKVAIREVDQDRELSGDEVGVALSRFLAERLGR